MNGWKLGLAAVTAAGAAAVVKSTRARARQLEAVAPELRGSIILRLPFEISSRTMLRLLRLAPIPPAPVPDGVTMDRRTLPGGVEVYTYDVPGRTRPSGALLWIHGGGYVAGDALSDHTACGRFARELGIPVVSVNYRLAPEHPFPAGLDDCYSALAWLHGQAGELGVDPGRIAIGGESAGGGLAAALAQRAHDRGEFGVCFQLLVYPMLDDRTTLDTTRPKTLVWTPGSNKFGWTSYLGHAPGEHEDRPHAVPARRADLAGLPPAWIGVGDLDLFHDEDLDYARRLDQAGVDCQVEVVPGMYHGAVSLLPDAPLVQALRGSAVRALKQAVG
ncbi:alpha/beta hydrolase [Amycolatopsis sp. YIM 10]|uniref:alpha/beta hydrolase n=1 Tax=Amycolatopsis sp. YIM 10 TaxID=2653857 RepID=UPI00128FE4FF|nr:alpha/beta hydrolase [Amycolatopsis sp. YIM 10]QFU90352.1 Carboxylesterase NlhH [Amycolatopsis sp. YIM 10]